MVPLHDGGNLVLWEDEVPSASMLRRELKTVGGDTTKPKSKLPGDTPAMSYTARGQGQALAKAAAKRSAVCRKRAEPAEITGVNRR